MRDHWATSLKNRAGLKFLEKLGEQFVHTIGVMDHQLANGDVVGGALTAPSTWLASPRFWGVGRAPGSGTVNEEAGL